MLSLWLCDSFSWYTVHVNSTITFQIKVILDVIIVISISIQTDQTITFYLPNTLCFCSVPELQMGSPLHLYSKTNM